MEFKQIDFLKGLKNEIKIHKWFADRFVDILRNDVDSALSILWVENINDGLKKEIVEFRDMCVPIIERGENPILNNILRGKYNEIQKKISIKKTDNLKYELKQIGRFGKVQSDFENYHVFIEIKKFAELYKAIDGIEERFKMELTGLRKHLYRTNINSSGNY